MIICIDTLRMWIYRDWKQFPVIYYEFKLRNFILMDAYRQKTTDQQFFGFPFWYTSSDKD